MAPQAGVDGKPAETVRVVMRCRPLNSKEKADQREQIVDVDSKMGSVSLHSSDKKSTEPPKTFTFDSVYGPDTEQEKLYQQSAAYIVDSVLEGFNGTIFAYGQTGTGKTFTMEGVSDPPELRGIIPRAFNQIFQRIESRVGSGVEFLVRASYLEIYNEEIRDLLSKQASNKMELKEDPSTGVYVKDLTSYVVKSTRECDKLRDFGAKNRHVGATAMNQDSSRSHSIYTITVESCETREDGSSAIRMGKLNLVDLAGSERQSKTQASGERLKEATKINLSLSALGNCISALVDSRTSHIPYRDSKLTRLLQDSLGGNTKTVMVANVGPADWNYDETLSTLRYANRAKNIKNKPKINEDPKDAMLREFQEEIARLRAALEEAGESGEIVTLPDGTVVPRQTVVEEKVVENVVEVVKEVEVEKIKEVEVEVEKIVEVEKLVEVERVIEQVVEVERVVEVEKEVEVERIVEVEKEVGVSHEEVERQKRALITEAEREKQALLDEQLQQREAKLELTKQLQDVKQNIHQERDAIIRAKHRLKELEGKVIVGGENLFDKSMRQAEDLRRQTEELAESQREAQELAHKVALEEEMRLGYEEQYASLQEEVEGKTKKLKKLWAKYKGAQAEILDLQNEFQREKEDILDTIRELSRQLKLKQLIMSACIPLDQLSRIERCSEWDEANEQWRISRLHHAGNNQNKKAAKEGSRLRRKGVDDGGPLPFDMAKAMQSIYFSYAETDQAIPEEAMSEEQAAMQAMEAERAAAVAKARKDKARKKEQAELDAALNF